MGTIQVKNVPERLHGELRRRAERAGMTQRDYVIALIERDQRRPTLDEWLEEVAGDDPVALPECAAEAVAAGRDERERELAGPTEGRRADRRR